MSKRARLHKGDSSLHFYKVHKLIVAAPGSATALKGPKVLIIDQSQTGKNRTAIEPKMNF
jgi:hypothetical protein